MSLLPAAPLTERLVGFCRFVRARGLTVGIQETCDVLAVARLGLLGDRHAFRLGVRALCCTAPEEQAVFDALFDEYWQADAPPPLPRKHVTRPRPPVRQANPLLVIAAAAVRDAETEDGGKRTTGASRSEKLRQTDFSQVHPADQDALERLALRLWRQMSLRMARRRRPTRRGRQVDLRRTLRGSLSHGGEPLDLRFRGRRPQKPRLVVLLDVSGSMDAYSFFLVRFLYALQRHFARMHSFVFSTRLTDITDELRARRLPDSLSALAETVEDWSSGTRIGDSLQAFNEGVGRRLVTRRTLVLILSDGLDTGAPARLGAAVQTLRRRAKKVLWLNPLLGMEGYAPLAGGIRAALPHLDAFLPAHNLDSLLALEGHLV